MGSFDGGGRIAWEHREVLEPTTSGTSVVRRIRVDGNDVRRRRAT
jgi:hypothetical protein